MHTLEAQDYHNVLHSIRTNCKKYSDNDITVKRNAIDEYILSNPKWHEEISISPLMIKDFVQVGHFKLTNGQDIDSIVIGEHANLLLNKRMINKSVKKLGINELVPRISLIGGVIVLLLSLFLYLSNSISTGYFGFSRAGTYSHESGQTLSWFHMFILGLFLIASSIGFKYLTHLDKKNK